MTWKPSASPFLVGMVHLLALPGTPKYALPIDQIVARAVDDARALRQAGFDAVLVENMGDRPYIKRAAGPEIVAAMTRACVAVRAAIGHEMAMGVQVLAGANVAALAVAQASGAQFIRAEGFVFGHVADEGMFESDAAALLRERRRLEADAIAVWADIKKKHAAHAMTADVSLAETAQAAAFFHADGVIVTGSATGQPTNPEHLREVAGAVRGLPVIVGSGADANRVASLLAAGATGVIVGTSLKPGGDWDRAIDHDRARDFVKAARR